MISRLLDVQGAVVPGALGGYYEGRVGGILSVGFLQWELAMIQTMSRTMLPIDEVGLARLKLVPDGAISIETDGTNVVLRASRRLQVRFERLLERHKHGELTEAEEEELQAIEQLDAALSWLNRLARQPGKD